MDPSETSNTLRHWLQFPSMFIAPLPTAVCRCMIWCTPRTDLCAPLEICFQRANSRTSWRCNFKGLSQHGGRVDFYKNLRALLLMTTFRMNLISVRSNSLDSTFKYSHILLGGVNFAVQWIFPGVQWITYSMVFSATAAVKPNIGLLILLILLSWGFFFSPVQMPQGVSTCPSTTVGRRQRASSPSKRISRSATCWNSRVFVSLKYRTYLDSN